MSVTLPTSIPFESDRFMHRKACAECHASDCYTRIYIHEGRMDSRFLCFNCASDYVEKKGYRELLLPILQKEDITTSSPSASLSASPSSSSHPLLLD